MLEAQQREALQKAQMDLNSLSGYSCLFIHENTDNPTQSRCKAAEANMGCSHSGRSRLDRAIKILIACNLLTAEEVATVTNTLQDGSQALMNLDSNASKQYLYGDELTPDIGSTQQNVITKREQLRQFLLGKLSDIFLS